MHRLFCLAVVASAWLPTLTVLAADAPAKKAAAKAAPAAPQAEAGGQDLKATVRAIDEMAKRGELAKADVPALIKLLADKQDAVRWHAARALGAIGPAASLIRGAADVPVRQRTAAPLSADGRTL